MREKGQLSREGVKKLLGESSEREIQEIVEWMTNEAEIRGFVPADSALIEDTVNEIISEKMELVNEKGMGAIGPLMGPVMSEFRGKMDGSKINELLIKEIKGKI